MEHQKKKVHRRCDYSLCDFFAMRLIGQCTSCENFYCRIHRNPLSHQCTKLAFIRDKERKNLENKLMTESESSKKAKIIVVD